MREKRGVFTIYLLMRLSCALLCFFCEKSWSICELPCAFVCFSIYLLYQIPVFIKYRTIKNRIDGQPIRSFISLYVFHRSRLLFSLTACFQADLSHLSFLSFHLTSQKSGCRRRQLHLRPFFVKIKKERLYSETSRYFIKELSDDEKVGQLFFMPQCVYVCSGKGSAVIFLL